MLSTKTFLYIWKLPSLKLNNALLNQAQFLVWVWVFAYFVKDQSSQNWPCCRPDVQLLWVAWLESWNPIQYSFSKLYSIVKFLLLSIITCTVALMFYCCQCLSEPGWPLGIPFDEMLKLKYIIQSFCFLSSVTCSVDYCCPSLSVPT